VSFKLWISHNNNNNNEYVQIATFAGVESAHVQNHYLLANEHRAI